MGASKEECIGYIQGLTEAELACFMKEALLSRAQDLRLEDGCWSTMRYCLAHVIHGSDTGAEEEAPSIVLVAIPVSSLPNPERTLLCEEGKCTHCGALVLCAEKSACCPVCDLGPVHCT
jgi:hypothetical protein